ncbi:MAG TPA: hypothetical protein VFV37_11115 [Luteibaculaceae bacterium]|nr:hypothetical protein [Luteibaculaceae bacterium]
MTQERIDEIISNGTREVLAEENCGPKNYDPMQMDWDTDKRTDLYRPTVERYEYEGEFVEVTTHYNFDCMHAACFSSHSKTYTHGSI